MNPSDEKFASDASAALVRARAEAAEHLRLVRETWTATRSVVQTKMVYCRLFGRIPTMDELRALGAMG